MDRRHLPGMALCCSVLAACATAENEPTDRGRTESGPSDADAESASDLLPDSSNDGDGERDDGVAPDTDGDEAEAADVPADTADEADDAGGSDAVADGDVPGEGTGGACEDAVAAFAWDFETPEQCTAWTHAAWTGSRCSGADSWQCAALSDWPDNPPGSTRSWGTNRGGFPANDECSTVASPVVDLSSCAGRTLRLEFLVAYSIETGAGTECADGGFVQVNDADSPGGLWVTVPADYRYPCVGCHHLAGERAWCWFESDWRTYETDVSAYAGPSFQVRFALEYDGAYPWLGLYVDDVRLTLAP
ncbi:MAG: hypothetical protein HY905_24160 [Deltaproteobacteria bacterium]|nr:hypothetical protein [Deltaproteobacteria bacterium]